MSQPKFTASQTESIVVSLRNKAYTIHKVVVINQEFLTGPVHPNSLYISSSVSERDPLSSICD